MLIYVELLRIIKPLEKELTQQERAQVENSEIESDNSQRTNSIENELNEENILNATTRATTKKGKQKLADMRHILGFLNQSEWIQSLNIGNIMQITPLQLEDFVAIRRNEQELDRFAFLETVSFLTVGYFCVSTEIRFIIQLKEEI